MGFVMKYYFLALATIVTVCVGCAGHALDRTVYNGMLPPDQPIPQTVNSAPRMPKYFAPPAEMMMRPGPMVDGPGPGVLGMVSGSAACPPGGGMATTKTQVRFVGPEGMSIGWSIPGGYAENQLTTPGRYNFAQAATYRLKLTDIPERDGLVLYPTLQVYPAHPQTDSYLAHNSVPLQITDEDLDQVQSNNFVTKVIYLPSPAHQELAIAGVETLVSTRLDPGVDPVAEADRRGTIMAVLRIGNMDLETSEQAAGGPTPEGVQPVSFIQTVDGEQGQHVPPMPIAYGHAAAGEGIPAPSMMGASGGPGRSAMNPMVAMGDSPSWGMPITGTPIGLPGPTHLPYGGPAGLKSHTVRNKTRQHIPEPVDHQLIDVKHSPGLRLPDPVKHIEYKETHPVFAEPTPVPPDVNYRVKQHFRNLPPN